MVLKKTTIAKRKGQTNARRAIDAAKKHGLETGYLKSGAVRTVRTVDSARNLEKLQWFANRRNGIDKVIDKVKVYKNPGNK
jgi:hypothetical protein